MYCGTCLHDNTLAAALTRQGVEALLVPTYTPIRTDEENVSQSRVFYGGVNVYLQQKSGLFRHTPWFLDALFNTRPILNWLGRRRASVDARKLGAITVSMLKGKDGKQRKELEKLLRWLETDVRPDVVHLSNAMLLGMSDEMSERLAAPVVCGLSGEDVFLERVIEPHYSRARDLLKQHARSAAAFVAMNRYYADLMIDYMDLDPARVHVIAHGLNLTGHATAEDTERRWREADAADRTFTIGYFARVCEDKGFHLLVEAFRLLCQDASLPPLHLRAAGYVAAGDREYLAGQQRKLQEWGLAERFEYLGEPDRAGKIAVLQSFDVMSVPTVYRESKGLSILEALANGVPVVLPAHGAFPEVVSDTGGGVLHEPLDPAALAQTLKPLILDRQRLRSLGIAGQRAIHERYTSDAMARRTRELYASLTQREAAERAMAISRG